MMLSVGNKLGPKNYGCSEDCDLGAFVKYLSYISVAPGPGGSRSPRCCCYCKKQLERTMRVQTDGRGAVTQQLYGVFACSTCGEKYMHESCRLEFERRKGLWRQHMVCSDECEVQAKMKLSTARLLGDVGVMALDPEPKSDGSLLKAEIADLRRAQARILRQPVCPGERVLWIRCVAGRG